MRKVPRDITKDSRVNERQSLQKRLARMHVVKRVRCFERQIRKCLECLLLFV